MVTLTTDQHLATDSDWLVVTGGNFNDDTLVECYRSSDPEQVVAYYAVFTLSGEYPQ